MNLLFQTGFPGDLDVGRGLHSFWHRLLGVQWLPVRQGLPVWRRLPLARRAIAATTATTGKRSSKHVRLRRKNAVRAILGAVLSAPLLLIPVTGTAQEVGTLRSGVVKISSTSPGGMPRTGTGFIVNLQPGAVLIVTAAHVVAGDKNPRVEFFPRQNFPVSAEVKRIETQLDVALLLVQEQEKIPAGLRALQFGNDKDLTGKDVTAIGFPPTLPWALSRHTIAAQVGVMFALSGDNMDEGNSGGPLVKDAAVIGMVTSPEQTGRALPALHLERILGKWGVKVAMMGPATGGRRQAAESRLALTPGTTFKDCVDCPEMVVVPAGRFVMGSPASEKGRNRNESPQHEVVIGHDFAIGKYEVTRRQFAEFVRATGYDMGNKRSKDTRNTSTDQLPVVSLGWNDAKAYAQWLTVKTGKPYRLLSEAEWEYAARAGSTTSRFWGEDASNACAFARVSWCRGNNYARVGQFKPNAFGVHDMLGNVYEWVEDCYRASYKDAPADGSAWTSGKCEKRVLRGGSFVSAPTGVRSAFRLIYDAKKRFSISFGYGVRVAMSLP